MVANGSKEYHIHMDKNSITTANFIKITLVTLFEYQLKRNPKLPFSMIEDLAEELYHNWSHSMSLSSDMRAYFESTLKELKEIYKTKTWSV